ncbi:MAG: hypothetical protein N2C14_29445 [Planctomycetales bacterium]
MILLGNHPDDGSPIYAIRSPFGPYIQCGEATDENPRPKGCWLPKGFDVTDASLEIALELLTFPRVLGQHPDTGADVVLALERFGVTICSAIVLGGTRRRTSRLLEPQEDFLTCTLDQAVTLLEEIKKRLPDASG